MQGRSVSVTTNKNVITENIVLRLPRIALLLLVVVLSVSGCKISERRAQAYYEAGMAKLEAGKPDAAMGDFRNALKADDMHKDARMALAALQLDKGRLKLAYRQYLSVIERYPDTLEARLRLAEIALIQQNDVGAERHGAEAIRLDPNNPRSRGIKAALDYNAAVVAGNLPAQDDAVRAAEAVLAQAPDTVTARRVVILSLMNGSDPAKALPEIDAAIIAAPTAIEFHMLRLSALNRVGDKAAAGAEMQVMYQKFPNDPDVPNWLFDWYVAQGDKDGALALLRDMGKRNGNTLDDQTRIVGYLRQSQGDEAALAELAQLAQGAKGTPLADKFTAMTAEIDADRGHTTEAIATLKALLDLSEPSAQTMDIKLALARVLEKTGDRAGATQMVTEILTDDPTAVEALKMRGSWALQDNQTRAALDDLTKATAQSPRDAELLVLLARAYEAEGDTAFAGQNYALAVEASGDGAAASLAHYAFLLRTGRDDLANSVLANALEANPGNVTLLGEAAQISAAALNWTHAETFINRLHAIDSDEARTAARTAQATLQLWKDRSQELGQLLQGMIDSKGPHAVDATILRTQVDAGKFDEALTYVQSLSVGAPNDTDLRQLAAGLLTVQGHGDQAEATYRGLVNSPGAPEGAVIAYYHFLQQENRTDEAAALLDKALANGAPTLGLRLVKADALANSGQFDAAVALYDGILADMPDNLIVANRFVRLLASRPQDKVALDRAAVVAGPLAASKDPADQAAFGWIAYLRGDFASARDRLEPAAVALPQDALVKMHLGLTYAALGRVAEARAALNLALTLAPDRDAPEFKQARDTLATLPQ